MKQNKTKYTPKAQADRQMYERKCEFEHYRTNGALEMKN